MHRVHEVFFRIIQKFFIRPVINDGQEIQRFKLPVCHVAEEPFMHIDFMAWQIDMDAAGQQYAAVHFRLPVQFRRLGFTSPQNILYCAKLVLRYIFLHANWFGLPKYCIPIKCGILISEFVRWRIRFCVWI